MTASMNAYVLSYVPRKARLYWRISFVRTPQKVICKGDEAILNNNSQRSKWDIIGPGGLDMSVPSVCLIVPPPNPIGTSLANK